jgi:hypothetical protein
MKQPSIATDLALTNQRLDFICEQLTKSINQSERWNIEKTNLVSNQVENTKDISHLIKENKAQWNRIDWLWRSIWLVVISQVIMVVLLFGAKFIPIIKP